MLHNALAAALIAAAATSLPASAQDATARPFKSDPAKAARVMEQGKQAVLADLKDPGSVQWRDLVVRRDAFLCGEFNAKNSYGGYVGFRKFVNIGGTSLTHIEGDSPSFEKNYASYCLTGGQ